MKTFVPTIFIFGVLFTISMAALSPEEKRAEEKKILDQCKASTKGTEDDINLILDRKVPTNYNGKCLLKCAHEIVGVTVKGKFSPDGVKSLAEKEFQDDSKAASILDEIINECKSITDVDLCEQSAKLADCMIKGALYRGIDPKKGIKESLPSN